MISEDLLRGMIPNLPNAQIRMIAVPWYVGQFVMTWAKHEGMLANMLARINDVEYEELRDKLLDSQISEYAIQIQKTIDRLGPNHPVTPKLIYIKQQHEIFKDLRNDIVHGSWDSIGPDGEYILKRKLRKQERTARTLKLQDLEDSWKKLDALGKDVINASLAFEGKEQI